MNILSNLDRISIMASSLSLISVLGVCIVILTLCFMVSSAKLCLILLEMLNRISKQILANLKWKRKERNVEKQVGQINESEDSQVCREQRIDKSQKRQIDKIQEKPKQEIRKIHIGDLYRIRQNLKKAFMLDDFLIMEDPVTVVTAGIQIIQSLGGISVWVLHKSKFGRRFVQRFGNDEDTETESNPQTVDDDQLKFGIIPILKQQRYSNNNNNKQKALNLYNRISAKYSHYSVTVILKKRQSKGVWSSLADFLYKQGREDEQVLILLT